MTMSGVSSPRTRREILRTRIRTLTSFLQKYKVQKSPTEPTHNAFVFVSHLTTLLLCGDRFNNEAKKAIAVAVYTDTSPCRSTLLITQNPHKNSPLEPEATQLITKHAKSLADIVREPGDVPLAEHIKDVWSALSVLNPGSSDYEQEIESLEIFVLHRSWRKFTARLDADKHLCGKKKLFDVISDWTPSHAEIPEKWIVIPRWLLESNISVQIPSRRLGKQTEWKFSDETKRDWAMVLAAILREINRGVERVKAAKHTKRAEAIRRLNPWCRALYYFVIWDARILECLLAKTNIADAITVELILPRESDTDEPYQKAETKRKEVSRYLETVVAWHAAIDYFSRRHNLSNLVENVQIRLSYAPRSMTETLGLHEFFAECLRRFPDLEQHRERVLAEFEGKYPDTFSGCVHAEATLMGLLNDYGGGSAHANQCALLLDGAEKLDHGVKIEVSKRCCWCCDWLGHNLETPFKLPGTHGIMYSWDPPHVGISESTLEKLEEALWDEVNCVILKSLEGDAGLGKLLYSRHSPPPKLEFMPVNKMRT